MKFSKGDVFARLLRKNNIVVRYLVATLGLILVALGVALSLKSNLGTAPVSCLKRSASISDLR